MGRGIDEWGFSKTKKREEDGGKRMEGRGWRKEDGGKSKDERVEIKGGAGLMSKGEVKMTNK